MRAVLIVNPTATSTTPAGRDLLAHALQSRLDLTVEHTDHRGHAIELADAARRDGVDLVIVHGGDGTVHGVVNGLLGRPGPLPQGQLPAVAVVPGGSANVFARSLGIPSDPVDATNLLIDLINGYRHQPTWRRVGLIDCGERWAVFNAGMGVDADVVAAVEAQRHKGRKVTAARYIRAAIPAVLASIRREATLTLQLPDRDPVTGVHFVFVSNSSPWTYANKRPVWTNPGCAFESNLGVFATHGLKTVPTLRIVRQMFAKRPKFESKQLVRDDDVTWLRVTDSGSGDEPGIATQIDGDYLGLRTEMTFRSVPDALNVVAPPVATPAEQR
ncbi:diacylglycerol/lipid kinase family protein [Mycobacterium talmoniae]|uniref:Diacylglycerol kinase n=1 Tax=Mycobacterium talmoniae TaxID=1858794 RepID=A0A1S1NI05_9MYCO|nr:MULTISPECIES: diacylglycerol kinase family protein [Mycobacterium]OHV03478.1 diacylglycerol kinase [Mycobacterium talmoniae]TDH53371.1 diacylglycerol kinase family lipid kinase [Mycobacterium eburneum]